MYRSLINICFVLLLYFSFMPVFGYENANSNSIVQQEFSSYMDNLKEKIGKNWNPPDILELNKTVVVFKVDNEGEIVQCDIKESSGSIVFDESAIEALSNSAPFGNFPSGITRKYITVMYTFETHNAEVDIMRDYLEKADKLTGTDNKLALKYINLAIEEVSGDSFAYFLYARRSKIKKALGDLDGANKDKKESERLKRMFDIKRINACKKEVEEIKTPYSYFNLANAYDIAGDYENAVKALDIAINMTKLNNSYKRYREEIVQRSLNHSQ